MNAEILGEIKAEIRDSNAVMNALGRQLDVLRRALAAEEAKLAALNRRLVEEESP